MATSNVSRVKGQGWETIHAPKIDYDEHIKLLNRHGISKRNILTKLHDKLSATKPFAIANDVMFVDDNPTQIKAVELGLKLHGMIDRPSDGPRVGAINILWTGGQPDWAVNNQLVNDGDSVPISTVEGTDSAPAPVGHTHPVINLKAKRLPRGKVK